MKQYDYTVLVNDSVDKIKEIVGASHKASTSYLQIFESLENNFRHDMAEGGKFLCSVLDTAKEIFPYVETFDEEGNKKVVNPLQSITKTLNKRFQKLYETDYRLSTHKTKAARILPPTEKKEKLSDIDKAINVLVDVGLSKSHLTNSVRFYQHERELAKTRSTVIAKMVERDRKIKHDNTMLDRAEKMALKNGLVKKVTTSQERAIVKALAMGLDR